MSGEIIRKVTFALAAEQDRILSREETSAITGRSLSSMWRDERAGAFPQRRKKGAKSVGYFLSEVTAWMQTLEVVTTETAKPVAIPGPGKKRGRPSKTASHAITIATAVTIETPEVKSFIKAMRKTGLKPLEKITPDGNVHRIEFEDDSLKSVRGLYILDINHPPVGFYECKERKIVKRWAGCKRDTISDQDMAAYNNKIETLRMRRKEQRSKI